MVLTTILYSFLACSFLYFVFVVIFRFLLRYVNQTFPTISLIKSLISNPFKCNGFDRIINLPTCVDTDSIEYTQDSLSLIYKIPQSMCSNIKTNNQSDNNDSPNNYKILEIGSILALTDQITSVLIMCADKNHRPGVSIKLSGSIHSCNDPNTFKALECGKSIVIKAKIIKLGATLGFANMSVYSPDGKILATCNHIKYLKTGIIWDNFLGYLAPLVYRFHRNSNSGRKTDKVTKKYLAEAKSLVELQWTEYSSQFDMKDDVNNNDLKTKTNKKEISDLNTSNIDFNLFDVEDVLTLKEPTVVQDISTDISQDPSAFLEMHSNSSIHNMFNTIHGGAMACAIHRAAILHAFPVGSTREISSGAQHMGVQYLSPIKGFISIEIQRHSNTGDNIILDDEVFKLSSGVPRATYHMNVFGKDLKKKKKVPKVTATLLL